MVQRVDDIDNVFDIVAAITANGINFVFPALFYFMLVRRKNKDKNWKYYAALAIFGFFIGFGVFTVVMEFISLGNDLSI